MASDDCWAERRIESRWVGSRQATGSCIGPTIAATYGRQEKNLETVGETEDRVATRFQKDVLAATDSRFIQTVECCTGKYR